jgi:alanine transaminase
MDNAFFRFQQKANLIEKASGSIEKQIHCGVKFPFKRIVYLNGSQPTIFENLPISFNKNVLSILLNKRLMECELISNDHKKRAKYYLNHLGGSDIGAYTASTGHYFIREQVAAYFAKRDGYISDPTNIILTGGSRDILNILF